MKDWQNGTMVLRWAAAGLLEAEGRFRRGKSEGTKPCPSSDPSFGDSPVTRSHLKRMGVKTGEKQRKTTPRNFHDVWDNLH